MRIKNSFLFPFSSESTAEESRHVPSTFDSGFVPITLDQNPFEDDDDEFFTPNYASRKFFSSFSPTFGPTIRPNGHRLFGRFSSSQTTTTRRPSYDQAMLGSGDFTVMRGGSFYSDSDVRPTRHDFFSSSSGQVRPYALPLVSTQPHIPADPFANFRDFADITGDAHEESDFSHKVLVYTNNETSKKHEPNNILEELQAIDDEKEQEVKKISKFKSKLSSTLKKKHTKKISSSSLTTTTDPLIAES